MQSGSKRDIKEKVYIILIYMFYSLVGTLGKYNAITSQVGSIRFFLLCSIQLLGFAIFTLVWQRSLRYLELSYAYSIKGTTVLWSMLFANLFFKETITFNNMLGSLIIILGIGVVLGE